MINSVTVTISDGTSDSDGDDEWGDGKEVVVLDRTAGAASFGAHPSVTGMDVVGDDPGEGQLGSLGGGNRALLVASLANLAISYNVVNIGLALELMAEAHAPATDVQKDLVSTGAILGMVAGQVLFGAAGDCLGRQRALMYSLIVCGVGAAGSAFSIDFSGGPGIYRQLVYWRLLLGAGAGGIYPLAATMARASGVDSAWLTGRRRSCCGALSSLGREEVAAAAVAENEEGTGLRTHADTLDTGSTAVALMFSMQGVGYLAARFTGYLLVLFLYPRRADVAWRLLLGLGAVLPAATVIMIATASSLARRYALVLSGTGINREAVSGDKRERGEERGEEAGPGAEGSSPREVWMALRGNKSLIPKLIGTAGSWFLFDVTFYGNQLYQADVMKAVFGNQSESSLLGITAQDSLLALIALPGYFVAVAFVGELGPRAVQVQGFVMMAVLYATIGLCFKSLTQNHAHLLMVLYSLTFLFSNFGPNSTTFLLPSLTFPDRVRGSLNGISAAGGKLGALLGSFLFEPAAQMWGVGPVLVICAVISLAGGALTLAFVNSKGLEASKHRVELSLSRDGGAAAIIHSINMDDDDNNKNNNDSHIHGSNNSTSNSNITTANTTRSSSRERTPLAPTERRSANLIQQGSMMMHNKGQYSRVGGADGAHHGTFAEPGAGCRSSRLDGGVLREGKVEYKSLSRGRGGGVEGEVQMGSGFGDLGSDDSDSDGEGQEQVVMVGGRTVVMV